MDTLLRLEKYLLPPPETIRWNDGCYSVESYSTKQKVLYCVRNFFAFTSLLLVSPLTLSYDWLRREVSPVKQIPDIGSSDFVWPPAQRGFATSLFQTSGLGTKWSATKLAGRCDWDKWMDNPSHIIHPKGFDYKDFFVDILSDPTTYIEMLKTQNVTAHRFSLEWSVIEPRPGEIDAKAVSLYRNFIEKLIQAGITPSVTLSHFVVPQWFYEAGNFQKTENIDAYVDFALKAIELFPKVENWWSFNELGVKAFQQTREVYPVDIPEGSSLSKRVHAAGISTRNMLIAHCKLHRQIAKLHPNKTLGVTHQWLKFDTASGNWLEKLLCYFLEKFAFQPVYGFFKEGHYCFEFPFMANIHFSVPKEEFEANEHFLMHLGVQAYPKAMIKMGWNGQQKPPCGYGSLQNSIFTFGSSCEPHSAIMRFGPRWKAEAVDEILDEAFALTKNVSVTEFGSDAKVYLPGTSGFAYSEASQADYLKQLTCRIENYVRQNRRNIFGLFCWSDLIEQMEWENGFDCRLAMIHAITDKYRRMIQWVPTLASQYLAQVYKGESQEAPQLNSA